MCQCDGPADGRVTLKDQLQDEIKRTLHDNDIATAAMKAKIEQGGKMVADREPTEFEREANQLDKCVEILFMELRELEGSLGPILAENYPTEDNEAAERGVESEVARRTQNARHSVESSIKLVQNIKSRVRV